MVIEFYFAQLPEKSYHIPWTSKLLEDKKMLHTKKNKKILRTNAAFFILWNMLFSVYSNGNIIIKGNDYA